MMTFNVQNIAFVALVLLTGLSAGLCFIWANTIVPGIGKLNDLEFLQAFKSINRVIQNPTFFIVFFGPFIIGILNLFLLKNSGISQLYPIYVAVGIYFLGLVLVTIFGNVPLNELLERSQLTTMNIEELKTLRNQFENKWNMLHRIRTIVATISFLLLILNKSQITNHKF